MYRTILVGVDGSSYAENALDVSIELAKAFGSKLVIATVHSMPALLAGRSGVIKTEINLDHETAKILNTMLNNYAEKAKKAGVPLVETKIITTSENAGAGLVKEAEALGCALVVIASRGLTGLKRTLLGSVAAYISEYTHCDVMIIRR